MVKKKLSQLKSSLAIASLIISFFSLIPFFGLLFGIISIILGIMALRQIKKENYEGRKLAIAGIILGIFGLLFTLLIMSGLFYYETTKPCIMPCKIPRTENMIMVTVNGRPLEGNYYWLTTEGSSVIMNELNRGQINFTTSSSWIDNSSLRIIKIKSDKKLSHSLLRDIEFNLLLDREYYDDIEKVLSEDNINSTLKKYSSELEEYHELRNVLHNGEYERHRSSIDLESKEIMNASTSSDFDLWYGCSLS